MSRTSTRIDGVGFEEFRVRHTGTVNIEDDQADELAIGEVVVTVNVGTVGDVQAKLDKDGVLARVAVLKQTETIVLEGEIKQLLVEKLGLYGGDTMPPPIKITPGERTPAQRAAKAEAEPSGLQALLEGGASVSIDIAGIPADEVTGEIDEDAYDAEAELAAWQRQQAEREPEGEPTGSETISSPGGGVVRLGQVPSVAPEARSQSVGGSVPKPGPFVPTEGVQTLGRIATKDSALARALESDGWS